MTPGGATRGGVVALLADLAATNSGVAFIYQCLDEVIQRWGLRDAVLVLEHTEAGRQAFRAGRRLPDGPWSLWHAAHGREGLHTDPAVGDAAATLAAITDLCRVALRLDLARYDSVHDALTGLYNRRAFEEMLVSAVGRSRRYGWAFSLVLVDLDDFKVLNDRLGHDAGDAVLRAVGHELRRALRGADLAARIGGDEFALILPATHTDVVPGLLDRLRAGLADQADPTVRFSTGSASCPDDSEDPTALRRLADERLYKAKAEEMAGPGSQGRD